MTVSFGVTEKTAATNTQILTIKDDGTAEYNEIKEGNEQSHQLQGKGQSKDHSPLYYITFVYTV